MANNKSTSDQDFQHPWQVNLERLIEILNQFTYENKDVAIRELLSNAADSISEHLLVNDQIDPEIRIRIDKNANRLTIEDTGVGMVEADLHNIFSKVASTTKDELRTRFQGVAMTQPIIGILGIGRLAAFLIAEKMIVETKSWKEGSKGLKWVGTSEAYHLESCKRRHVGTKVELLIRENLRNRFLRQEVIEKIVLDHSRNIAYPIYIDDRERPINESRAPWYESNNINATTDSYLSKLRMYLETLSERGGLFRDANRPVSIIPIWEQEPVTVKGVLYIPRDPHFALQRGGTAEVFCRGVFICHDYNLIPSSVGFVKGVIESPNLTPMVNRQNLVHDDNYSKVQRVIQDAVLSHIVYLDQSEDNFNSARLSFVLSTHRGLLIHGAISSSQYFFEVISKYVVFKSSLPEEGFTTLDAYLRRTGNQVIRYVSRAIGQGHLEQLIKNKKGEVIIITDDEDKQFIERFALTRDNVDHEEITNLADLVIDQLVEINVESNSGWEEIIRYYEKYLDHRELQITAKLAHFQREDLPAILIPDPKGATRDFFSQLNDDFSAHEIDPAKRRSLSRQLEKLEGRREVLLYLNASNEVMKRLTRLIESKHVNDKQKDIILHEVFHGTLIFAEMTPPLDHLLEIHNKALLELCINLSEAAQVKDRSDVTLGQEVESLKRKLEQKDLNIEQLKSSRTKLEQDLKDLNKQFQRTRVELKEKTQGPKREEQHPVCFLALPFTDAYKPIVDAVRTVLGAHPYYWQVITAEDDMREKTIYSNVVHHIRSADCYLAEISEQNVNVMMEMGMMQMHPEKPLGLLCQEGSTPPTNIANHILITYPKLNAEGNVDELVQRLREEFQKSKEMKKVQASKRYLSPVLLKDPNLSQEVVNSVAEKYTTVEDLIEADDEAIAKEVGIRTPLATYVKEILGSLPDS